MNKLLLLLFVLLTIQIKAQPNMGSVKAGYFTPNATEGGFIIGYEGGWFIDDNFIVGFSADWFNKNFVDRKLVAEYNEFFGVINSVVNELRAKTNVHSVPLMFTINTNQSISHKTRAYFTAGAGLDILLVFYLNFERPEDDEFQGAFDFAWRIGGGIIYELGRRSDLFGEISYHNSKPSWEYEVKDRQTGRNKIFERRFDMSGMMLRVGVRFFF